jgi:hypothetical protein
MSKASSATRRNAGFRRAVAHNKRQSRWVEALTHAASVSLTEAMLFPMAGPDSRLPFPQIVIVSADASRSARRYISFANQEMPQCSRSGKCWKCRLPMKP